jgi:hypothetical protein
MRLCSLMADVSSDVRLRCKRRGRCRMLRRADERREDFLEAALAVRDARSPIYVLNFGNNLKAFCRSIAWRSAALNTPQSCSPFTCSAAFRNGKSVPNTI